MKDYIQVTIELKRKEEDKYTTNNYSFTFKGEGRESTLPKVRLYIEDLNELTSLDVEWRRNTIM